MTTPTDDPMSTDSDLVSEPDFAALYSLVIDANPIEGHSQQAITTKDNASCRLWKFVMRTRPALKLPCIPRSLRGRGMRDTGRLSRND